MYFFTSPTSTINLTGVPHPSPAYTSTAMSRSDSRDSTTSCTSTATFSTSPALSWDTRPTSSSSMSITYAPRRDSTGSFSRDPSCGWLPSPFRSCLSNLPSEPTSFLSDDDLLDLALPSKTEDLPPVSLPIEQTQRELSTEEQIAILRAQREKDELAQRQAYVAEKERERRERAKVVRFNPEPEHRPSNSSGRRPSTLKRRSTAVRRNLAQLGN